MPEKENKIPDWLRNLLDISIKDNTGIRFMMTPDKEEEKEDKKPEQEKEKDQTDFFKSIMSNDTEVKKEDKIELRFKLPDEKIFEDDDDDEEEESSLIDQEGLCDKAELAAKIDKLAKMTMENDEIPSTAKRYVAGFAGAVLTMLNKAETIVPDSPKAPTAHDVAMMYWKMLTRMALDG